MIQEKEYEDTLSCKTYMKVGGFVNGIMRFGGSLQQSHMSYANPGFYYGLGNFVFSIVVLVGSYIGIPICFLMFRTFLKYKMKTQAIIYGFASLVGLLQIFVLLSQLFKF
jgi:hypothetical protein